MPRIILDTNVVVGALFRRGSASGRLVEAVRAGRLALVWDEATRDETARIVSRIPRLRWSDVDGLYTPEGRYRGVTHPDRQDRLAGVDRCFAALAAASGAALVTSDDDFLSVRDALDARVLTPGEAARLLGV